MAKQYITDYDNENQDNDDGDDEDDWRGRVESNVMWRKHIKFCPLFMHQHQDAVDLLVWV